MKRKLEPSEEKVEGEPDTKKRKTTNDDEFPMDKLSYDVQHEIKTRIKFIKEHLASNDFGFTNIRGFTNKIHVTWKSTKSPIGMIETGLMDEVKFNPKSTTSDQVPQFIENEIEHKIKSTEQYLKEYYCLISFYVQPLFLQSKLDTCIPCRLFNKVQENVQSVFPKSKSEFKKILNRYAYMRDDSRSTGFHRVWVGNILNHQEDYMMHQVNCKATWSHGLSKVVFDKWPKSNVYQARKEKKVGDGTPGTIDIRGKVINIFGQFMWGKTIYEKQLKKRFEWFKQCLDAVKKHFCEYKTSFSIAVPYKIGCGLAGGNWKEYQEKLSNFNKSGNVKLVLYVLPKFERNYILE